MYIYESKIFPTGDSSIWQKWGEKESLDCTYKDGSKFSLKFKNGQFQEGTSTSSDGKTDSW